MRRFIAAFYEPLLLLVAMFGMACVETIAPAPAVEFDLQFKVEEVDTLVVYYVMDFSENADSLAWSFEAAGVVPDSGVKDGYQIHYVALRKPAVFRVEIIGAHADGTKVCVQWPVEGWGPCEEENRK